MLKCRLIDFLFTLFPIKRWQGFLIRRHIQKCPACLDKLADAEDVKPFLIRKGEIENLEDFWPAVKARQGEGRGDVRIPLRRWRWVYASAFLAVAFAGLVWLSIIFFSGRGPSEDPLKGQFQINFIEIENEPAQAFVFRPQDSNTYFVWVEKKS